MELRLHERPNRCLACNLTQGLPQVFSRHPIINVKGIVKEIEKLLGAGHRCQTGRLVYTEQREPIPARHSPENQCWRKADTTVAASVATKKGRLSEKSAFFIFAKLSETL